MPPSDYKLITASNMRSKGGHAAQTDADLESRKASGSVVLMPSSGSDQPEIKLLSPLLPGEKGSPNLPKMGKGNRFSRKHFGHRTSLQLPSPFSAVKKHPTKDQKKCSSDRNSKETEVMVFVTVLPTTGDLSANHVDTDPDWQ
uniref:Uncharacterized protein n=1 Tax=Salix viminalis TaxID=40686 RepID=A0A6N2MCP5_SALVM